MEVAFSILYHPKVLDIDVPGLDASMKKRISAAIIEKLTTHPHVFGKPLQVSLRNYRSLRVGDYRIIFVIDKKTIAIDMIAHRSIVYDAIIRRLQP